MNVIDIYKDLDVQLIRYRVMEKAFPAAVLMCHINGDFNFSSVIRNANAFGFEKVFYLGKKRWDRRGSVGTHHYTDVIYVESINDPRLSEYTWVALENNVDRPMVDLETYLWPGHPLLVVGEEGTGIPDYILDRCEIVTIPQFGSVRSINAAVAGGIAMYKYAMTNR